MLKRFVVIGSATALAALVLFLTMLAEPTQPGGAGAGGGKLTPQDTPPPVPHIGHGENGSPLQRPFANVNQYRYSRVNKQGQLIQVFGKTLTPKPQGVSEVELPGARIHLTPSRVIEIRAERGTFVAPDNQPRNGDFKGRVVLTLFEGPADRAVDLTPNSPDVAMRVFLLDAKFDMELGQIESRGPVHLTGPRIDFRGRDLTMIYSEARGRIEHLEVIEGRQLRLKPGDAQPAATQSAAGAAQNGPQNSTGKTTTAHAKSEPATKRTGTGQAQYYTGRLDKRVAISSRDIEAEADRLNVWFCLSRREAGKLGGSPQSPPSPVAPAPAATRPSAPAPAKPATPAPAPKPAPLAPTIANHANGADFGTDAPLPIDESMAPPGVDDVNITWAGPLVVDPLDAMPDRVTGPDDYALELVGQPVRITTANKDVITAATFDYLGSTGRIRLIGDEANPLVLDSPSLGVLRGPQLVIDQSTGMGQVPGAGTLKARGEPGLADAVDPRGTLKAQGAQMPRGMSVKWNDRLDLSFYLRPRHADAKNSDVNRLRGLKDVMFRGAVVVQHPDFDVHSDRLNLSLDDPDKGSQSVQAINASGGVVVNGRGEREGALSIKSDQLVIELERGKDGQMEPHRLLARGSVVADQPGRKMTTGSLDVGLGMAAAKPAAGVTATRPAPEKEQGLMPLDAGATGERRIVVRNMHADQGVTIVTQDPPMNLVAMRLDADAEADQIELFGLPDKPARVERGESVLSGEHIVMGQASRSVHVIGPGRFAFMSLSSKVPGANAADAADPKRVLAIVNWDEAMHFADDVGLAQFTGRVRTQARTDTQASRLLCDDLRLKFTHVDKLAGAPAGKPAAGDGLRDRMDNSDRAIQSVTARGNVFFEAERWEDKAQTQLVTRLTLTGDHMHFEEPREEVQVLSPGQMLFEDYRPDGKPAAAGAAAAAAAGGASPVHFSGRGATLFKWKGRLVLDAYHNDMLMQDRVQMIHREPNKQEVVQLDCQNLLADLEATGGLGVWFSASSPQPKIKSILADRSVRLLADHRTINTDHMKYTGDDQTIILQADPGKMVEIIDDRDPTARYVREIRWDLLKNQASFEQPSPAVIPLNR
ncbi:MAG: hypothetical protein K8S99_04600 [Planctomycetes bacterium]|nr:hypothetical protein [Planctomycetota bacterium]